MISFALPLKLFVYDAVKTHHELFNVKVVN